jgi:cobalt-zinc-cadmium efflux system outer membrane protein
LKIIYSIPMKQFIEFIPKSSKMKRSLPGRMQKRSFLLAFACYCLPFFIWSAKAQTPRQYLKEAAENNPGLQAAYLEFEASMQQMAQTKALPDPTLSFGYFISPVETRIGPQRLKLSLVQKFPWFGTNDASTDVQMYAAKEAYQTFLAARDEIFYQVRRAYLEMLNIHQTLALQAENLQHLETRRRLAVDKYSEGKQPLVDVLRIELDIDNTRTEMYVLESEMRVLKLRFNRMLNRSDDTQVFFPDSMDAVSLSEIDFHSDSIALNPRLGALEMKINAAEASELVARREGAPSFAVGIDYVMVDKRTDVDLPDNGRDALMPMVSMSLPIFSKRSEASVKQSQLMQKSLSQRKIEVQNRLVSSLKSAVAKMQQAKATYELHQSQITKIMRMLELLQVAYADDQGDFEQILTMQQQVLKHKIAASNAATQFLMSIAEAELITSKSVRYE